MNKEKILELISKSEDEIHDFKQEWYKSSQHSEFIKDIFSFVNTSHHEDCYIIIGVDDDRNIIGLDENDEKRRSQQQLIDWVRTWPTANNMLPPIEINSLTIDSKLVDVITIKDTNNIPIYLSKRYKGVDAWQIFTRNKDVNTPRNDSANFWDIEELWRKRFSLDQTIQNRYIEVLKDIKNWSYFVNNDQSGFLYNLNPDFHIIMDEDTQDRHEILAYSLDCFRKNLSWINLKFNYRNITIDYTLGNHLDGAKALIVAPHLSSLNDIDPKNRTGRLTYYSLKKDSLDYHLNRLIVDSNLYLPRESTKYIISTIEESIVFFEHPKEEKIISENIFTLFPNLHEVIIPSEEEIENYISMVSMDIKNQSSNNSHYVKLILTENKLAKFINEHKKEILSYDIE